MSPEADPCSSITSSPLIAGQVMAYQMGGEVCAQRCFVVDILPVGLEQGERLLHLPFNRWPPEVTLQWPCSRASSRNVTRNKEQTPSCRQHQQGILFLPRRSLQHPRLGYPVGSSYLSPARHVPYLAPSPARAPCAVSEVRTPRQRNAARASPPV